MEVWREVLSVVSQQEEEDAGSLALRGVFTPSTFAVTFPSHPFAAATQSNRLMTGLIQLQHQANRRESDIMVSHPPHPSTLLPLPCTIPLFLPSIPHLASGPANRSCCMPADAALAVDSLVAFALLMTGTLNSPRLCPNQRDDTRAD